jgi:hypothetical protein
MPLLKKWSILRVAKALGVKLVAEPSNKAA